MLNFHLFAKRNQNRRKIDEKGPFKRLVVLFLYETKVSKSRCEVIRIPSFYEEVMKEQFFFSSFKRADGCSKWDLLTVRCQRNDIFTITH